MACHLDGALRELIRYHFKIYLTGLDASLFHLHDYSLLGKIPLITKTKFFPRMVSLAIPLRHQRWLCVQREMGWTVLHRACGTLYH